MADFNVVDDVHTSIAGTGPQTLTLSCEGLTPAAVLIYVSRNTAFDVNRDHMSHSVGVTDGVKQGVQEFQSESGQGTSDANGRTYNTLLVDLRFPGTNATDYQASLVSLAANALNINISTNNLGAIKIFTRSFYGTAAQAMLFDQAVSGSAVLTHNFGTTNHHWYHCIGGSGNTFGNSTDSHHSVGVGYWPGSGGIGAQGGFYGYIPNGRGESAPEIWVSDVDIFVGRGAGAHRWRLTAADSNSVTLTRQAGTQTRMALFLAVDCGSSKAWVDNRTTPVGTTTWNVTGVGFEPMAAGALATAAQTLNSNLSGNNQADHTGYGLSGLAAVSSFDQQGVDTTNTETRMYDDAFLVVRDGPNGELLRSGAPTFNSDGWTATFAASHGTALQQILYAFENQDVGGPVIVEGAAEFEGVGGLTLSPVTPVVIASAVFSGVGSLIVGEPALGFVGAAEFEGAGSLKLTPVSIGVTIGDAEFEGVGGLRLTPTYVAPEIGAATFSGNAFMALSPTYLPPAGPIIGSARFDGRAFMIVSPTYVPPVAGDIDVRFGDSTVQDIRFGDGTVTKVYYGDTEV